jgi:hypothetical protein
MNRNSPRWAQKVKELVTYLTDLYKGRGEGQVQEARDLLRRFGAKRFGTPSIQAVRKLNAIEEMDRLAYLNDRLLDFRLESWDDLLNEA